MKRLITAFLIMMLMATNTVPTQNVIRVLQDQEQTEIEYKVEDTTEAPESDQSNPVEAPTNPGEDFTYFEQEDYYLDIDNDGITETLSNITCGGDGHSELYVYKTVEGQEKVGYVDWLQLDLPVWYWGCNAVQTRYNPEQNKIEISYCPNQEDAKHHKTTYANFDIIKYVEYDGNYLPGIDIEEAYERYGEINER